MEKQLVEMRKCHLNISVILECANVCVVNWQASVYSSVQCLMGKCFVMVVGSFQLKMLSVRQGTQHFTDENKVSRK